MNYACGSRNIIILNAWLEHLRFDCFMRLLESIFKNHYRKKRIMSESEK